VDLEEELEDVPVGGPPAIEDDLDRLGVTGMVAGGRVGVLPAGVADAVAMTPSRWRSSSCASQKQPPARIAVSVFSLIGGPSSNVVLKIIAEGCWPGQTAASPRPATSRW
jgi:hypothetical protein